VQYCIKCLDCSEVSGLRLSIWIVKRRRKEEQDDDDDEVGDVARENTHITW
jgi:hypothetical protein